MHDNSNSTTNQPEQQPEHYFECLNCGALGIYSTPGKRDFAEREHNADCNSDNETLQDWNGGVR